MPSFTSWQGGGPDSAGNSNALLGPSPVFRDAKDARMAAFGSSPDTNYPDGYLGTQGASTRRADKLLDAVHRTNTRPYSRGVHKGERINPGDYVWPAEFNLWSGIEAELEGHRFASEGAEPVVLTNDGKAGPRGVPRGLERPQQEIIDQQRRSMLQALAPNWR
jgi:hypothetical protein